MIQDATTENLRHNERIEKELHDAGAVPLGMKHFIVSYLANVIHRDEHIEATIFGRHNASEGLFGIIESALVATDSRVISINHHLGNTIMDEFAYKSVSGVRVSETLIDASVTLFTKVAKYHLSYVSLESARKFSDYIESRIEGRE